MHKIPEKARLKPLPNHLVYIWHWVSDTDGSMSELRSYLSLLQVKPEPWEIEAYILAWRELRKRQD